MVKYASYDPFAPAPSPVTGWYDPDHIAYPSLPPQNSMIELTDEQWAAHFGTDLWAVTGGVIGIYARPVPPPSLEEQAAEHLSAYLARGISIASDSSPDINAAYALDDASTAQIFQIGLYASQFGVFPSGAATIMYPDVASAMHTFSVPQFVALLRAVAPLVSALTTQAGVMRAGGVAQWPDQTATIP